MEHLTSRSSEALTTGYPFMCISSLDYTNFFTQGDICGFVIDLPTFERNITPRLWFPTLASTITSRGVEIEV